ncbi:alpha-amylase family glycosyl hydrolase [Miltoncostaea oceani]|uniref:alpha-amylase family glycosyl hydrolase n=1 Tax=Miltoncostaea oceani TaxID=2843216 RepID=UPI001C3CDD98|nr:alpha-amylase family glycosyl hydrolase [Miltoncostaea oceani]
MTTPWWKSAVVYQVYPRSFADADGDGVGDLDGVVRRLGHLARLGVDALWLSPFYPSPMVDFGYDVADYTGVDPVFGDMATFDTLVGEAHALGIRVIIDWVPNHSSDAHPWFVASRSSRDDPHRDWYVWRDGRPGGLPPNDWESTFGGPAWTHDPATGQWYLHSFAVEQPDLNWANPAVADAMLDTLRFWLDRGVDGFRIDVVQDLGKEPDAPAGAGEWPRDQDWPAGHAIMRRVRALLDGYDDRMAVGEVYVLDQRRLVTFLTSGDELHLAHDFVFLRCPWDAARFHDVIDEFTRLATGAAWPTWCLENHDHPRVATRWDDGGHGPARARAAALLLLGLRGTAFLFQGQELGLPDAHVPADRIVDLDGRDPERAPIPWERPSVAGPGAGFTTGEPWLPIVGDAERLAVAAQRVDPRSDLSLWRRLIALRRSAPALSPDGAQALLDAGPGVLAWVREAPGERLLIAINMSREAVRLDLDLPGAGVPRLELSTDPDRVEDDVDVRALGIAPDEGVIVRLG